jgi:ParB family transcriptional regulator, chromosome partitioning protein
MIRKTLGRGLDALISDGDNARSVNGQADFASSAKRGSPSTALLMLEPDQIIVSRFQPRKVFAQQALEELATAIKNQGVVEPLIVRPAAAAGNYELVAGERRLRASRLAGLGRVPVIVRELDDRGALEMSLVENLLRENLSPTEEADAFNRLNKEFGLTHEEIGNRIGKSRTYVTNTIRLTQLPNAILSMVERGELTAGQVRPLLSLTSADEQVAEAMRIAQGKLSARDVEQLAAGRRVGNSWHNTNRHRAAAADSIQPDPNATALAERIQLALKRKVTIVQRRGRQPGRVELEYYSNDDLTVLARILLQQTS